MGFSDAHLIARVLQAGDPNAFGELVRRYQSPVRSFLRKLTRGDEALADDRRRRRSCERGGSWRRFAPRLASQAGCLALQ